MTPNGGMNTETWEKIIPTLSANIRNHTPTLQGNQKWALLFVDGLGAHAMSPTALQSLRDHRLLTLCMPSHSSHRFQPLDLSFFNPSKQYVGQRIRLLSQASDIALDQYDLLEIVIDSTKQVLQNTNTVPAGFKKANLFPGERITGEAWCQQHPHAFRIPNPFTTTSNTITNNEQGFTQLVLRRHYKAPFHTSSWIDLAAPPSQVAKCNPPPLVALQAAELRVSEAAYVSRRMRRRNQVGENPSQPRVLNTQARIDSLQAARRVKELNAEKKRQKREEQQQAKEEKKQQRESKKAAAAADVDRVQPIIAALVNNNIRSNVAAATMKKPTVAEMKKLVKQLGLPVDVSVNKAELVDDLLAALQAEGESGGESEDSDAPEQAGWESDSDGDDEQDGGEQQQEGDHSPAASDSADESAADLQSHKRRRIDDGDDEQSDGEAEAIASVNIARAREQPAHAYLEAGQSRSGRPLRKPISTNSEPY